MVRGNWQKRVEQANERKKSNHQRKLAANQVNALLQQYGRKSSDELIAILEASSSSNSSYLRYCKSYFFSGECRSRKCRLSHKLSLLDHLRKPYFSQAYEAANASPSNQSELDLLLVKLSETKKNEVSSVNLDDLAYVIANGAMVFDRNRGGVLRGLSDENGYVNTGKEENSSKTNEQIKEIDTNAIFECCEFSRELAKSMPVAVLEHIILFLPDYYAGIVPQVCKSWNDVGQLSKYLWKNLIQRRKWPEPDFDSNSIYSGYFCIDNKRKDTSSDNYYAWRSFFISNFSTIRNMRSIQRGIQLLVDRKERDPGFDELKIELDRVHDTIVATQCFKSTTGSPSLSNSNFCAAMKVLDKNDKDLFYHASNDSDWSDNSLLCAYTDGTLRIFETISDARGRGVACRQTACVRSILRSKGWILCDMTVDYNLVFCVSSCSQTGEIAFNILSKDEVICNTGGVNDNGTIDSEYFQIYNVSEMIQQYLSSEINTAQDLLDDVTHFAVTSMKKQSLLACGKGSFFLRFTISFSRTKSNCDDETEYMCIFSATKRSIVYLDQRPLPSSQTHQPRNIRFEGNNFDAHSCSVLKTESESSHSFSILTISQETYSYGEDSDIDIYSISALRGVWNHRDGQFSCTLELIESESRNDSSELCLLKRFETGFAEISLLSNHRKNVRLTQVTRPDHCSMDFYQPFSLTVEGTIVGIDQISEHHCVILTQIGSSPDLDWLGVEGDEDIHEEYEGPCTTHAIIINMLTSQVIDGLYFGTRNSVERSFTFGFCRKSDFLACEVGCEAILISGRNARRAHLSSQAAISLEANEQLSPTDSGKKKKKNKRLASKTNKKDGFARGMSLRG